MRLRAVLLGLWLAVPAGQGWAEAPETAIRPEARPTSEDASQPAVQPVLRPVARPDAVPTDADRIAAGTDEPAMPQDPALLPEEPGTAPTTSMTDGEPAAPRDAPVIGQIAATTEPETTLAGPRQMVLAEELMADSPPPLVFVDGWTGDLPQLRPGTTETVADSGGSAFLRPEARPETLPVVDVATVQPVLRPRLRPATPVDPSPLVASSPDQAPVYGVGSNPGVAPDAPQFSALAVAVALRPEARSARVVEQASSVRRETARGAICGTSDLQGDVISAIRDGGGCGVEEPVRVRSVGGIQLSTPATMDCTTASALLAWVDQSARPALRGAGGGLVGLQVMGSYACRPRNNQSGARLSEHGKGRAIDIGGFILASGEVVTVLNDWGSNAYGAALRAMHRDACGPFGTVLGPNANAFHRNHFHFDTARYRSGSYCR